MRLQPTRGVLLHKMVRRGLHAEMCRKHWSANDAAVIRLQRSLIIFVTSTPHAACMLMQPLQMLEVTPSQAVMMKTEQSHTPQSCWLTINRAALQPLQGTPGDPGQALHAPAPTPWAGCHVDSRRVLPLLTACQLQLAYWRAGRWLHLAGPLPCPSARRGGSSGVWRLQVHSRGGGMSDAGGVRGLRLGGCRGRPAGGVWAHVGALGSVAEVCG